MGRYIKGTGHETKLTCWRCIYCDHENTSLAGISVSVQQGYGAIGVTKNKAEVNVRNTIKSEMTKKVLKVNEKHVLPEGVIINGKCSSCGRKQPWSMSNAFPVIRLIAGIIIGIMAATVLYPYVSKIDGGDYISLFLLFMTVVLVTWGVSSGSAIIMQLIISKKMSAYEEGYFPKLLD